MRRGLWTVFAVSLGLAVTAPSRADEAGGVKPLLDKAIKAKGGDKLAKSKAATWKGKAKLNFGGNEVEFSGEWFLAGPDKSKFVGEANGMQFTQVLNGDKGWMLGAGETRELEGDFLTSLKQEAFAQWAQLL